MHTSANHEQIASRLSGLSPQQRQLLTQRLQKKMVNGHTAIAQTLKRLKVTHVYGISGTPIDETLAAIAQEGIRPIGVHDQQAATLMSTAQNYITGRLTSVAICSAGPAITNATTGILVAKDNGWPLVVLGGRRSLKMQGMGCFQDLDAVNLFQSLTKYVGLVDSTKQIPIALAQAVQIAMSGRPGPVYLDITEDALKGDTIASCPELVSPQSFPGIDGDAIEQAAKLLLTAKHPAVILGKGLRWSAPYAEVRQLVEDLQIPFVTSPMGRGSLPDDHPLCYNAVRSLLLSQADLVLLLGARLDWTFRYGAEIPATAKLIQVDIHAPEIGHNIPLAVGIVGDVKQVLQQLLTQLDRQRPVSNCSGVRAEWFRQLDRQRQQTLMGWEIGAQAEKLPMSPQRLIAAIRDEIPKDAICAIDGNVILAAAQQLLPSYLPASRFTPGTNGCMGVGVPFGIAAKLAYPDRPVIVITGDLAFGFNAMELETAVRLKIPAIFIIANNEGHGIAMRYSNLYPKDYPDRVTMFQPNIRYEQIMTACGGHGEFVDHPHQIKAALARSIASGLPACINVAIDPFAPYPQ
ncbi:MAG TPA: hypothetical protein DDZ80_13175 [Cyanobacteria bacterium UBA8803]|nr:hypothetical protein [Cyanobacteria bacterium UBA9273]HBL59423.1 hypothetical protein [Cyanobacteria bacterium UBA8803]